MRVNRPLGYISGLDGVRAVAISAVVAYHATGLPPGGMLGVDLFFVLSGFLITTLLLEELDGRGRVNIRGFYARRARRLLPALFVMLAGFLALAAARGVDGLPDVARAGFYTGNLARAFVYPDPLAHSGIRHLWSLAEEEQFYLVWPAVVLILKAARRPALWFAAIFVGLIAYRIAMIDLTPVSGLHLYYGPDMRSDGLAAGALLAIVAQRRTLRVAEGLQPFLLIGVCAAFAIPETGFWWPAYGSPVFDLVAAGFVTAAVAGGSLAEALSAGPLVWLGKRSYSLYLWHLPILWALPHSLWPAGVVLSVGAAALSYRFVEQPFRRRRPSHVRQPAPAVTS